MRREISVSQGFWLIFLMGSGALGYVGYNAHDLLVRYQQYTDKTNQQVEEQAPEQAEKPGIQQPTTDYTVRMLRDDEYFEVVRSLIQSAQDRVFVAMYLMYAPTLVEGDRAPPTDKVMKLLEAIESAAQYNHAEVEIWLARPRAMDGLRYRAHQAILDRYKDNSDIHVQWEPVEIDLHDKLVLIDNHHIIQGSHNWTNGAFHNNKETSLWFEPEDGQNWSWSRYRKALVAPKTTGGSDQ